MPSAHGAPPPARGRQGVSEELDAIRSTPASTSLMASLISPPLWYRRRTMSIRWDQLCKLGLALPEVVEDIWYRTPALKIRGKAFVRIKEDGQSVVFLLESVDEQEALIEARPDIYHITDHYRGYAAVMARLSALSTAECRLRLERAWRLKAPRTLVKQLDGQAPSGRARAR